MTEASVFIYSKFITEFNQINDKLQKELYGKLVEYPYGLLEISVKDTGIGIKKEDQKKLFKLFSMVDSSKNFNQ